jgi:hypothetical protein
VSKIHLVVPDSHAHYKHHNERATWLSRLIVDLRPDVVVHIGDSADMPSLSGYDKGKRGFQGRTYRADIEAHLDFQDRLWAPVRATKKRLPRRVFCIGNHEQRIEKALDLSPELTGAIGMGDLELDRWYDTVVPYEGNTPGKIELDGVWYAHYFTSGVKGLPVGGEHPADSLITKRLCSSTCGHLHLADWSMRSANDRKVMGCFVGCFQDYRSEWAGDANDLWWSGVVIKRNVEEGSYDPEFISIERLKKEYA